MSLVSIVKRAVPGPIKSALRSAQDRIRKRRLFGRLAPLIPPEELMHDGPPTYLAFKENGEEFFRLYKDLCDLKPHERMLDIGCGIGRKTFLLTGHLSPQGTYEGMDIVKSGIDWCSTRISARHPNFQFRLIDVFHQLYNPGGTKRASDYRFPFPDRSFDFITLGSVFTHTLPADTENYLKEIARVIKPEGRCLISWFLLNSKSARLIEANKSTLNLVHILEQVCRTNTPGRPEVAIGYDEAYVLRLYEKHGLTPALHYGSWCGRNSFLSYQDLVLTSPRSGP